MSYERRKIRIGRVVSDKMDKTVTVVFEWRRPHPIYKKSVRRRTRFKAHDPSNDCRVGDLVRIIEGRPYSKTKRWRVAEILEHEEIAEIQPEEIAVEDPSVLTARATQPEEAAAAPIAVDDIDGIEAEAEEEPVAEIEAEAEEETVDETEAEPEAEEAAEEPVAEVEAEAEEETVDETEAEPEPEEAAEEPVAEVEAEAEEEAADETEVEPEPEEAAEEPADEEEADSEEKKES